MKKLFITLVIIIACFACYYCVQKRYKYSDEYSFKSHLSEHRVEVYYDSWSRHFPGNSSDAPCIVKLIDQKTGKCLHKKKFEMMFLLDPIIINGNSVEIGKFTYWTF